MRLPVRTLLAGLLSLAALPSPAPAQEGKAPEDPRRLRWQALTEEERRALRARFEEFRRLPREDQERLRDRTRNLDGLRERMEALLPGETVEQLRSLPPRERFEAYRAALESHLGERRDLLRRVLPPESLEQLKSLPPPDRARRGRQLLRDAQRPFQEEWLRRGEEELPAEEVERLRGLPPQERFQEHLRLRKERTIADLESKPEFGERMPHEAWGRLKALPPRQFFSQLSLWRAGTRHRPGPPFPPFLAPTPEERANLESLAPPERRHGLERLFREKVRRHLVEALGLDPTEADRIAGLPREQVFQELRRLDPAPFSRPAGPAPRVPR